MRNATSATTEELKEILCTILEQSDETSNEDLLSEVIHELAKRMGRKYPDPEASQHAWKEFLDHYAAKGFGNSQEPTDEEFLLSLITPQQLTPSYHGIDCLGNGEWPGYDCQCDECDYYLTCFPIEEVLTGKREE